MFYDKISPLLNRSYQKELQKGEILYNEGDDPQEVFFIQSGLIGLFHIAESGKETFLRVFGKGAILGHRSYFAESPYHASSLALSKTLLNVIPKEECQRICIDRPDLLKEVTKIIALDLGQAELRLAGIYDKSANQRVAESLVYLKMRYPYQKWARKEIAEYAFTTFETVTRTMGLLEKKGLIEKMGRDYKLCDVDSILKFFNKLD